MSTESLILLLPEIVILVVAVWAYVGGAFTRGSGLWTWIGLGGLAVAGWHLAQQASFPPSLQVGAEMTLDPFTQSLRWLCLVAGGLLVLTVAGSASRDDAGERIGSLLVVVAGMMLVVSARDLIVLFLGMELISIPTYVLLYLGRRNNAGLESVVKYFFLSILASAVFLYGLSFLYGMAGSMQLDVIAANLPAAFGSAATATSLLGSPAALGVFAAVLILGALAFKIAAVPMHFYAADVYQGTSSANAAILSVAPKVAGVVALVRLSAAAWTVWPQIGWPLVLAMALATMTVGNLLALWQTSVRRTLAYSSVAHSGYLLIGLAVALGVAATDGNHPIAASGLAAMLFYLAAYVVATIGAFAAVDYLGGASGADRIEQLAGRGRTQAGASAALAVCLFSLAGLPPLAGFFGKLSLFFGALRVYIDGGEGSLPTWCLVLAVTAALNAAIAAAYYLRIIAALYFRPASTAPERGHEHVGGAGSLVAATVCAFGVVAAGVVSGPLMSRAEAAGNAVLGQNSTPSPTAIVSRAETSRIEDSPTKTIP